MNCQERSTFFEEVKSASPELAVLMQKLDFYEEIEERQNHIAIKSAIEKGCKNSLSIRFVFNLLAPLPFNKEGLMYEAEVLKGLKSVIKGERWHTDKMLEIAVKQDDEKYTPRWTKTQIALSDAMMAAIRAATAFQENNWEKLSKEIGHVLASRTNYKVEANKTQIETNFLEVKTNVAFLCDSLFKENKESALGLVAHSVRKQIDQIQINEIQLSKHDVKERERQKHRKIFLELLEVD